MRRAALALIGASAGTTLVIIAKLGPDPSVHPNPPIAGASPTTISTPSHHPSTSSAPSGTPSATAPRPGATPTPRSSTPSGTFAGPAVTEKYGVIQVTIVVSGDRLADVSATYPTKGKSGDINSRAIPELRQEALIAQSADVATVSGATYTSDAYRQSLQGALDRAKA